MPFSDKDFISKEEHELDYVLRKWGRSATQANRDKLIEALDRFHADQAYEPHTRARFYDFAEKTGLAATLEGREEAEPVAGRGTMSAAEERSPAGKRKLPWWLILLIIVLVVVLALILLRTCGGCSSVGQGQPQAPQTLAATQGEQKDSTGAAAVAQTPTPAKKALSLDSIPPANLLIHFMPNSVTLAPGEELKLEALVSALKALGAQEGTLVVSGHAASIGYPEGERRVSEERAAFVAKRLSDAGLSPSIRIDSSGQGATAMLPGPAAASRRVEISLR